MLLGMGQEIGDKGAAKAAVHLAAIVHRKDKLGNCTVGFLQKAGQDGK